MSPFGLTLKHQWQQAELCLVNGKRMVFPIDSRTVKAGDLFVAIKGPRSDGHDYVSAAIAKGASAAMVTQKNPVWREHIPLLVVSDTNTGLS